MSVTNAITAAGCLLDFCLKGIFMLLRCSLVSLIVLFAVSCRNSNNNSSETASAGKINADGSTAVIISLQDLDQDVYCFMQYNHSQKEAKNIPNDDTSAVELKQAIEIAKKSTMLTTHPIPKNDLTNIYGANTSKIVEGNELAVMDDDEFNSVKAKMIVAGGQKSEKTCESLRNVYVTADVNEATSMGLAGKRVGLKFKVGVRPSKNLCGWGSCSNGGRTTLPH